MGPTLNIIYIQIKGLKGEIKGLNSDVSCGDDDDTSLDSLSPEKEAPVPQLISDPSDEQLKSLEKKINVKDAIYQEAA